MMMHGLANASTVLLMLVSRKNLRMFIKIDLDDANVKFV